MNIYDLDFGEIERVDASEAGDVAELINSKRAPLIFTGLGSDLKFLDEWNLDFLKEMSTEVPIQRPEGDGVNYFIRHERIPMSAVVEAIRNGESMYIGAQKITGKRGLRSDIHGLGQLAETMRIPEWIDKKRIYNGNFWLGAGNNKTLLHYDAWDSILLLGQGEKEFFVFSNEESPRMHQYSAFNFKALVDGRVLHSKIRPMDVQEEYREEFSKLKGLKGTVHAGEVMFVPAGFWHYVESKGINVAVNFFIHTTHRSLHFKEPLRTFWIKDNITVPPVAFYKKFKAGLAKLHRFVAEKPVPLQ